MRAGRDYGTGSAGDWAAKGTALLGVRAVIARSFERIHRSNLVRLGVAPLELVEAVEPATMVAGAKDVAIDITPAEPLGIGSRCTIRLRIDGDEHVLHARLRADTAMEIALLQSGGVRSEEHTSELQSLIRI